jgi:hypothetical protein
MQGLHDVLVLCNAKRIGFGLRRSLDLLRRGESVVDQAGVAVRLVVKIPHGWQAKVRQAASQLIN